MDEITTLGNRLCKLSTFGTGAQSAGLARPTSPRLCPFVTASRVDAPNSL